MDKAKRKRLEAAGWKLGTVRDFLDLTPEEESYIELKLELAKNLQKRRIEKKLTQVELARMLKSSQSRIAKMEAGDPTVSVDLLVRSLLVLGSSRKAILRALPQ
jgi:DNA-binding XRE family transcriptional regulator